MKEIFHLSFFISHLSSVGTDNLLSMENEKWKIEVITITDY